MRNFILFTFCILGCYLLGFNKKTEKIPVDGQELYNSNQRFFYFNCCLGT